MGWPGTGRPGTGREAIGTPGWTGLGGGALYTGRGPVCGTIMRGDGGAGAAGFTGAAAAGAGPLNSRRGGRRRRCGLRQDLQAAHPPAGARWSCRARRRSHWRRGRSRSNRLGHRRRRGSVLPARWVRLATGRATVCGVMKRGAGGGGLGGVAGFGAGGAAEAAGAAGAGGLVSTGGAVGRAGGAAGLAAACCCLRDQLAAHRRAWRCAIDRSWF